MSLACTEIGKHGGVGSEQAVNSELAGWLSRLITFKRSQPTAPCHNGVKMGCHNRKASRMQKENKEGMSGGD
jgi:hypothetical protein